MVLGANGQVGSELCLLLSMNTYVRPIAVARSEYSLALLRKLGVDCRVANTEKEVGDILSSADGVIDLVHPWHVDTRQMRRSITERVKLVCSAVPVSSPIIYASTMSVYRLDPDRAKYTIYGSTKLFAERELSRACNRSGHSLHIQRFGQVHGAMQSCSLAVQQQLFEGQQLIVPSIPSFTVFVSSISEAVELVLRGQVQPGIYTMISDPPWSYKELLEWLAQDAGAGVEVLVVDNPKGPASFSLIARLESIGMGLAMYHKEFLSDLAARYVPHSLERYKQNHRARSAAEQIRNYHASLYTRPFFQRVSIPGPRIRCLSDSRRSMPPMHERIKQLLARLSQ